MIFLSIWAGEDVIDSMNPPPRTNTYLSESFWLFFYITVTVIVMLHSRSSVPVPEHNLEH